MIAVDTNILVFAHRSDSPWHVAAAPLIKRIAEGSESWAIAWPCVHEFISIATHPKFYRPASTLRQALVQVEAWMASPRLQMLAETSGYWSLLRRLTETRHIAGPQIHDARIATLCLHHGISELLTADRDFSRFPELKVRNPLVG